MEILFHILTFILLALLGWSGIVGWKTTRILKIAKDTYGKTRFTDKLMLVITILIGVASSIILFVYPGLIYQLPSVAAVVEVAFAFMLLYLHDLQFKNWKRFQQALNS